MKLMTLSTIALSFCLAGGVSVFAQAGATPEPQPQTQLRHRHHSPEHETRRLTRELNLSPEQAARIEPILAARHQQMRDLRERGSATREQRRAISRSTRGQIDSVLSDQQRQQLHTLRAEHHHGAHRRSAAPAV